MLGTVTLTCPHTPPGLLVTVIPEVRTLTCPYTPPGLTLTIAFECRPWHLGKITLACLYTPPELGTTVIPEVRTLPCPYSPPGLADFTLDCAGPEPEPVLDGVGSLLAVLPSVEIPLSLTGTAIISVAGVLDAALPLPAPPLFLSATADSMLPLIAGQITDAQGSPVARRVRVFERGSNTFIGEVVSDPVTGYYEILVPAVNEYQRIVLAEDESNPLFNDLIDRIRVGWPE